MNAQPSTSIIDSGSAFPPAVRVSALTLWLTRLVLTATGALFTVLALMGLNSPSEHLAVRGITLNSALGVTTARIGFGAFPLVAAIVLFGCLSSSRRHLAGLYFLIICDGIITFVRVIAVFVDGPVPGSVRLLAPECIILAISLAAVFLQFRARRPLRSRS
jgi:hypothetical protein